MQAIIRYPNKKPAPGLRVKFEATDGNRHLHMVKESSNVAKTNNRGEVVFTFDVPPDANQATRITVKVTKNLLISIFMEVLSSISRSLVPFSSPAFHFFFSPSLRQYVFTIFMFVTTTFECTSYIIIV